MGFIRTWLQESNEIWDRISEGDASSFTGMPNKTNTPPGDPIGTPPGDTPPVLNEHQRKLLERCFHAQYGRFPQSEYEFERWLKNNW